MSARFEIFLARIYVDVELRIRFLADPRAVAEAAGLSAEETLAAEKIDRLGLEMAATSFRHKRAKKQGSR